MSYEIPTYEPDTVTPGDTVEWTLYLADFDPGSWTLTYYFVNQTGAPFKIVATNNGDGDFLVSAAPAITSAWIAGLWYWQAIVANIGGETHTVRRGRIKILPGFSAANAALDNRSHVRQVLDALEALIAGKALTGDQVHYQIAGRSLARLTPEQVVFWFEKYKGYYAAEIRNERIANGLGQTGKIKVRFNEGPSPDAYNFIKGFWPR